MNAANLAAIILASSDSSRSIIRLTKAARSIRKRTSYSGWLRRSGSRAMTAYPITCFMRRAGSDAKGIPGMLMPSNTRCFGLLPDGID